jgi:glyoxalase family protein
MPIGSQGLHHVTAISCPARRNLDFYAEVLGRRLVKKTVNFDDPGTDHLYFGDGLGNPGSVITLLPLGPTGTRPSRHR